jgi:hypothetical protein
MKKLITFTIISMLICLYAEAKKYPEIKFEKTTIDVGTFSQDEPEQKAVFKFTNVGKAKLVINYVHTSCGCTVAEYPKDFISPGGTGEIIVTYNGEGKLPGKFKKHIQIFTNCKDDLSRVFIQGYMSAVPVAKDSIK